jgi:hypothetical protein
MKGITCASGETTLNIDISEFEDTEFAYGMFTSTRDPRLPTEKMGVTGQVTQRKGIFTKDKYYVEISANPEKDHSATLRAFLSLIEKNIQAHPTRSAGSRPKTWRPTRSGWCRRASWVCGC